LITANLDSLLELFKCLDDFITLLDGVCHVVDLSLDDFVPDKSILFSSHSVDFDESLSEVKLSGGGIDISDG
jgi:hypothetical protein